MSGKCQHIFVDESGGTDLPDVPASEHDYYVISGVLVPGEQLTQAQRAAESIVERHAGDGELKSSRIGGKLDRRERILSDIARHQFTFYCLVVNKNLIWRDSGLRWKPSFYKFLHRMFYSRIKGAYLELQIVADEYGRSEFMTSFATYIQQMGSLFETFRFERSESAPLLQIADIVAGSMRRAFSGDDPPDTLKKFTDIKILIEEWPPKEAWGETSPESSAFDEAISGGPGNGASGIVMV